MQRKGKEKKDQRKFLAQTFLNHRQMGESEAYYRIFKHLHLSESNLKSIYVATGFPENRLHFLRKVKDILEDGNEEIEDPQQGDIQLPGKEGKYRKTVPIHEKYAARPDALENMCLAQFATSFDTISAKIGKSINFSNNIYGQSKEKTIISWNPEYEQILPTHIKLKEDLGYMRLRKIPAVLRIHKLKEDKNPHEYFYSQLLLYRPWQSEKELYEDDLDACIKLYDEKDLKELSKNVISQKSKIEKTQDNLFPHKNNVEAARAVLENFANPRSIHIGDELDPENEQMNEESAKEGARENEEYVARHPGDDISCFGDESSSSPSKDIYKRIDISNRKKDVTICKKS